MDEFALTQESGKGSLAKDVLENDQFQEAFEAIRSAILQKWEDCPVRDKEGQHELKLMRNMLEQVKTYLVTTLESGKMADIQLASEQRMDKLKRIYPK